MTSGRCGRCGTDFQVTNKGFPPRPPLGPSRDLRRHGRRRAYWQALPDPSRPAAPRVAHPETRGGKR
jgi:hypothetical protein